MGHSCARRGVAPFGRDTGRLGRSDSFERQPTRDEKRLWCMPPKSTAPHESQIQPAGSYTIASKLRST